MLPSVGKTSSRGPNSRMPPSCKTIISSASCKIRSWWEMMITVWSPVLRSFVKGVDQHREAPQVDARLRFVEDGELRLAGQQRRDLNPLQLPAGEGGVDLPETYSRAQSPTRERYSQQALPTAARRTPAPKAAKPSSP